MAEKRKAPSPAGDAFSPPGPQPMGNSNGAPPAALSLEAAAKAHWPPTYLARSSPAAAAAAAAAALDAEAEEADSADAAE